MSRVVAAAVACGAFALLTGSDGSLSARNVLVRETATILPEGTPILHSDYHEQCLESLKLPSPPCLSVRFWLAGSADDRAGTLLERTHDRWNVTADGPRARELRGRPACRARAAGGPSEDPAA